MIQLGLFLIAAAVFLFMHAGVRMKYVSMK